MTRPASPGPGIDHSICRYPFPVNYIVDDRTLPIAHPLASNTIRRKPVPVAEIIGESSCTRTPEEENRASIAQGSGAVEHVATRKLIEPTRDSSNILVTSGDATASRPHSPTLSPSSSLPISLSQSPLPPTFPRLRVRQLPNMSPRLLTS